jgi:hypothetical protein
VIGRPQPVSIGELRAVLAHVRALDAPRQARRTTGQLVAVAAFVAILAGSLRAATTHAYLPSTRHQTIEESRMRTLQSLGVVSSIAIASAATAQNAVQWRVEDGGNGHWYQVIATTNPISWADADAGARARGGLLASVTSAEENSFVRALDPTSPAWGKFGPWLGGFQAQGAAEPSGGWSWISGEPWSWAEWTVQPVGEPNNAGCGEGNENRLHFINCEGTGSHWNDIPESGVSNCCTSGGDRVRGYIIEWASDCNGDGTVDLGQIFGGFLTDANANGTPDCCEQGLVCCGADIDESGAVNGVDLAAVLNNWGTSGGKQPRSDVNADGIVDGADLAEVLNGWGSCP